MKDDWSDRINKLLKDHSNYDKSADEIEEIMNSFVEVLSDILSRYMDYPVKFYIKRNDDRPEEYIIYMSLPDTKSRIIARYKLDPVTAYPVLLRYDSFITIARDKQRLERATLMILKNRLNPLITIINEAKHNK